MKQSTIALVLGLMVLATPAAFAEKAAPAVSDAYYQVSEVTLTEVMPTAAEIASGYLEADVNTFSPVGSPGTELEFAL